MAGRSIEDVLGAIKVPVRSVAICLDADLQAEHDELSEELGRLRQKQIATMGETSVAKEVAEKIVALEAAMRDSEVVFKFRGLSKSGLKNVMERFPAAEDANMSWDVEQGAAALLSASAVQPTMNEDQAGKLLDTITQGQADRLVGAAWLASTGSTQVPFSVRASELTASSEQS